MKSSQPFSLSCVTGHLSAHDDAHAMRRVLERVAVVKGDVRILAGLDGSDAFLDAEKFCGVDGDAGERLLGREAIGGGEAGFEKDDAGLRHVSLKTALQRERDPGLLK